MSTQIDTITKSGIKGTELTFVQFRGPNDIMIQLTQGFGNSLPLLNEDEPGYIQLTMLDAYKTIDILARWLKAVTERKAAVLQKEIDKNKQLKDTMIKDTIECQHFISDLKILDIPIRLLY